jgi:hypothetical protein
LKDCPARYRTPARYALHAGHVRRKRHGINSSSSFASRSPLLTLCLAAAVVGLGWHAPAVATSRREESSAVVSTAMRRVALRVVSALALVALWLPGSAVGHGPCECLHPVEVEAGGHVRVGYPAYRVIFNPRPVDLGIAPRYLASAYRADVPTTRVLSRSHHRPTRRGQFRVPTATPPGLFMVLVFDGEEGGDHNTWEYLHVIDRRDSEPAAVIAQSERGADSSKSRTADTVGQSSDDPGARWAVSIAVGIAGLVIGAVVAMAAARLRNP